ncbi:MAG: hypothetical protein R3314_12390, partial [Longimicrobiales bacterium]|nr:hypothetical protein [Longimicrobiales bacterium]
MNRRTSSRPVIFPAAAPALLLFFVFAAAPLTPTAGAAQDVQHLRQSAWAEVDERSGTLTALSGQLWRLAETALREHESADALTGYLAQEGFAVERGVAGMPTAFVARWGSGGPVIGILA